MHRTWRYFHSPPQLRTIGLQIRMLSQKSNKADLWQQYSKAKEVCHGIKSPVQINPKSVFANNELQLSEIQVYGFDYDYTLAVYTRKLQNLIYSMALNELIHNKNYPPEIKEYKFDPNWGIRGLHYDVKKGFLMKIDAFHKIQLGTVYRGVQAVSDEEVLRVYQGVHIPITQMSNFHGGGDSMRQLVDLFSLAQVPLIANVSEYFIQNRIDYDPNYLFNDIEEAFENVHTSGKMHSEISADMETYVKKTEGTVRLLTRLHLDGKKLFLITNSGFPFVDKGMNYLVGPDWLDLFDVVITDAHKPKFFDELRSKRPFRKYNRHSGQQGWKRVWTLSKGKIYMGGNIGDFTHMTGWQGAKVLYFGDHVYSDLADPALRHGWRTGAIIPEIEGEIAIHCSLQYQRNMMWLLTLQKLTENLQNFEDAVSLEVSDIWRKELERLKVNSKMLINVRFGSTFHSYHNATYFTRRLSRFADIYTSHLSNLYSYSTKYTFYPLRSMLAHEMHLQAGWHHLLSECYKDVSLLQDVMGKAGEESKPSPK